MQLKLAQLPKHLQQQPLAAFYWIHGEEILLRQEAKDLIRQTAKQAGFENYQRLEIENQASWQHLSQQYHTLSLFNDKTLIDISNLQHKLDAAAMDMLIRCCQNPAADKIVLLTTNKLTQPQLNSRCLQLFNQLGVIIAILPIAATDFPHWIMQRFQQAGLQTDQNSIQLLAELTSGNLLACQQAITKLALLYPKSYITPKHISTVTINNARYTIFELSDAILRGNSQRVLAMLNYLQAENTEATLVLWILTRELRQLITMLTQLQQGKSMSQVVAAEWRQRQAFYQACLARLNLTRAKQLLQFAHHIDCSIKGLATENVWQQLSHLSLAMAGKDPLPNSLCALSMGKLSC